MKKRLLIVALVIISLPVIFASMVLLPFEIFIYGIRWIVTGRKFPDAPLGIQIVNKLDE